MPVARQASTTSGPCLLNGPTVLQTTEAPAKSSLRASGVVADLDDLVVGGLDAGDVGLHRVLQLAAVAAGGNEGDVVLAEVLADQPAGVAGGAVDDDWLAVAHAHIPIPPSTGRPTPLMKREASEARKTTASAMSSTAPSRPDGVELDDRADGLLGRPEQADLGHVVGQPRAHRGGDQAGVDAVDADAVAELAGLHRGHAGEPVDAGLGGGVDRDAGEGDRGGDRRDVDDHTALAGRTAGAHGAERVLETERGAEQVDVELLADGVRVEVDDQAGDLDAGVVDQDVEAAELSGGLRDGGLPVGVVGGVEVHEAVPLVRATRRPWGRGRPAGRR